MHRVAVCERSGKLHNVSRSRVFFECEGRGVLEENAFYILECGGVDKSRYVSGSSRCEGAYLGCAHDTAWRQRLCLLSQHP